MSFVASKSMSYAAAQMMFLIWSVERVMTAMMTLSLPLPIVSSKRGMYSCWIPVQFLMDIFVTLIEILRLEALLTPLEKSIKRSIEQPKPGCELHIQGQHALTYSTACGRYWMKADPPAPRWGG